MKKVLEKIPTIINFKQTAKYGEIAIRFEILFVVFYVRIIGASNFYDLLDFYWRIIAFCIFGN